MSLINWRKNGWLLPHTPDRTEIDGLLAIARRDLKDSRTRGLSNDWKFNIAYNAGLQSAFAALYACGFTTPKGESHHFRVIASLEHSIGLSSSDVSLFESFRKKRNMGIYDVAGVATAQDAQQMIDFASELFDQVVEFLQQEHHDLI
jgi:hypothetical protein